MHRRGQCKCLNCHEFYVPDVRNKSRQKYCAQPQCRQASKRASQRRWSEKPQNQEHFSGTWNVDRVRAWRFHAGRFGRKTGEIHQGRGNVDETDVIFHHSSRLHDARRL